MVFPGGGAVMTFAGAGVCASAGATKLAATKAAAASESVFIITSIVTATRPAQPWEVNTAVRLLVARSPNFSATSPAKTPSQHAQQEQLASWQGLVWRPGPRRID